MLVYFDYNFHCRLNTSITLQIKVNLALTFLFQRRLSTLFLGRHSSLFHRRNTSFLQRRNTHPTQIFRTIPFQKLTLLGLQSLQLFTKKKIIKNVNNIKYIIPYFIISIVCINLNHVFFVLLIHLLSCLFL